MPQFIDAIERLPVATLVHLFVALVLGVDLIVNGELSTDALTYAGIVEGGNIGVGAARAHVAAAKVASESRSPENVTVNIPPGTAPDAATVAERIADYTSAPDFDMTPLNAEPVPPEGEPTA